MNIDDKMQRHEVANIRVATHPPACFCSLLKEGSLHALERYLILPASSTQDRWIETRVVWRRVGGDLC